MSRFGLVGATNYIGQSAADMLHDGHEVIGFSRTPRDGLFRLEPRRAGDDILIGLMSARSMFSIAVSTPSEAITRARLSPFPRQAALPKSHLTMRRNWISSSAWRKARPSSPLSARSTTSNGFYCGPLSFTGWGKTKTFARLPR